MEEEELLRELIDGSEHAAREFCDRYRFLVMGVCRRFQQLGVQDAEDIFIEVFERLWRDDRDVLRRVLEKWQPGSLPRYLRKMTFNMAIDRLRGRVEIPVDPLDGNPGEERLMDAVRELWHAQEVFPGGVDPDPGPEVETLLRELQRMVAEAIEDLSERCREVVRFVDLLEHSYEEAATHFGITRNNLGVTLMRCRERLAALIERNFPALKEHLRGAL